MGSAGLWCVGEVIVLSEVYLGAGSSGFLSFFI
jgi:hypothetical protein